MLALCGSAATRALSTTTTLTSLTTRWASSSRAGGGRILADRCRDALESMREAGTLKSERVLASPQGTEIVLRASGKRVVNLASNNYLGLANDPLLVKAAKEALDSHGFGMGSVRFICGTQDLHTELEAKISAFHQTEDTILFPSCFDANASFFEAILTERDAIISDSLNHASIIDGIRLSKAKRLRYEHLNVNDLKTKLKQATENDAELVVIATDGAFSMDGDVTPLDEIVKAARDAGNAIVFVDECHATGVLGHTGRGTPELFGVNPDVITSTLGKALGGATGGYTTGPKCLIDVLRNKARSYLFSNSVSPSVVAASLKVFDAFLTLEGGQGGEQQGDDVSPSSSSTSLTSVKEVNPLLSRLRSNTHRFRDAMASLGFGTLAGHRDHPVVPVILGDAKLAADMADALLDEGLFVVAFSYPVVPKGAARLRCQLSAAHTDAQLDLAIHAFAKVGRAFGVIS